MFIIKVSKYKKLEPGFQQFNKFMKIYSRWVFGNDVQKRVILLYDIEYEFHGVNNITSHRVNTQYVAQENNQDN